MYQVENVVVAVGIFFLYLNLNLHHQRFWLLLLLAVARIFCLRHLGLGLDSCLLFFFFVFFRDLRLMRFPIHNPIDLLLILLIRILPINLHSISPAYTNFFLAISIISISIYLHLLNIITTLLLLFLLLPSTIHLPQYAPNQLLHPPPLVH